MALVKAESVEGFQRLPALRQIGLMIGLAASVALGVAIVLWSQTPNYTLLYGNLSSRDAGDVVEALQKAGLEFKIDESTGAVMVPSAKVHTARMELAKDGLPQGNSAGFEMLQQDQGFGTSQFIETARYQRALEGELGRTIAALRNVESARVHLAIPKRSVFLRDHSKPTASVMVNLYSGRTLEEGQVAAIVHLVSSAVPHLEPGDVTVVDQQGNLLSSGGETPAAGLSATQLSYTQKLEQSYGDRIRELLEPLVGPGRVRASVAADLDFTVTERTEENYNPDLPALRSEQTREESSSSQSGASGVPGALTNQPPEAGQLANAPGGGTSPDTSQPHSSSKNSVRNYELDKTISHTRLASGSVRRLSIAVVIDDKQTQDKGGKITTAAWPDDQLQRFTGLIKEAVGFDARRGDTVSVINSSFAPPPAVEPVPPPSLFERPWVWTLLKQIGGVAGVLILVFGLMRPVLRSLAERGTAAMQQAALVQGGEGGAGQLGLAGGAAGHAQLQAPQVDYEQHLRNARAVVKEDPKRVAQVVKNWVAEDG